MRCCERSSRTRPLLVCVRAIGTYSAIEGLSRARRTLLFVSARSTTQWWAWLSDLEGSRRAGGSWSAQGDPACRAPMLAWSTAESLFDATLARARVAQPSCHAGVRVRDCVTSAEFRGSAREQPTRRCSTQQQRQRELARQATTPRADSSAAGFE